VFTWAPLPLAASVLVAMLSSSILAGWPILPRRAAVATEIAARSGREGIVHANRMAAPWRR
jgi:hypothetical protein